MSIASRITSIEGHIQDIYDMLEVGGADLTNVNKNIDNVNSIMQTKYLDYINDGTDEIYNNWDKVTYNNATSAILNDIIEAPIKIKLKANDLVQQYYQGYNLFPPTLYSNGTAIKKSNSISNLSLNDDVYSLKASSSDIYFGQAINAGTTYQDSNGVKIYVTNMTKIAFELTNTDFAKNFITAYDSNNVSLGYTQITDYKGIYTIPENTSYITFRFGLSTAVSGTTYSTQVLLYDYTNEIEKTYERYVGRFS